MDLHESTLPVPAEVAERGWTFGRLPMYADDAWQAFAAFWEDLPRDRYVKKVHRSTRMRRLGRLLSRGGEHGLTVERLPHGTFHQSTDVNSVYGGQVRAFAPVDPHVYANTYCRRALAHDLALIRELEGGDPKWVMTIHMIRIPATGDATSAPAPEGRHSDGHDYVVMHLINRKDCAGGDTRLYRKESDEPVLEYTLEQPLETIVLDDRAMEHDVSPIRPDGTPAATRDMMIIDFDRLPEEALLPGGLPTVALADLPA